MNTKELLNSAEIVSSEYHVPGSLIYYPYGWKIRNKIYKTALNESFKLGYEEIHLPDLVNTSFVNEIDNFANVFNSYLHIQNEEKSLAASHEAVIYSFLSRFLKINPYSLPLRWCNLGSAFRKSKNTAFPFNYGERSSFLECYGIFETKEQVLNEYVKATQWNRHILENLFNLPTIEVVRPQKTNKAVSSYTTCIDTFLPSLGKTIITGMTYFHDTIFTEAFNVKYKTKDNRKNSLAHTLHFGLSDNFLFSLLDTYQDKRGLILPRKITCCDILFICDENFKRESYLNFLKEIKHYFINAGFQIEILLLNPRKFEKVSQKKIIQGYPCQVILGKREFTKRECKVSFRHHKNSIFISIDNLSISFFQKKLQEYDIFLEEKINTIKLNMIEVCYSINQVEQALNNKKVVELRGDFEKYHVQNQLKFGEVLGTSPKDKNKMYIAKRI